MRTGAIFARGSCRALKWMAMLGVVFALGAGSAVAQVSVTAPKTVAEAGRATITISAKVSIDAGDPERTVTVTVDVTPQAAGTAPAVPGAKATQGEAADSDSAPATVMLTIPANTGDAAIKRTVTDTTVWQTRPDLDAEDEVFTLTFDVAASGVTGDDGTTVLADPATKDITITDSDEQEFELTLVDGEEPEEGSAIAATLKAMPAPTDFEYVTVLAVDKAGYAITTETSVTIADDAATFAIGIQPPDNDGDRDEDTLTLSAVRAGTTTGLADALEIMVADIHGLPDRENITAKAFMEDDDEKGEDEALSVMEGGPPVYVTVTVDRGKTGYPDGEALEVTLMPVNAGQGLDFRLEMSKVEIEMGTGKRSADVKLWALADDDVGAEELMFNLVATGKDAKDNGGGESMGMFSIMIADATSPMVSVKDGAYDTIMMALGDAPLNPGNSVSLMTADLFDFDPMAVSVAFGASVEGSAASASASGEMVMVMAEEAGEAKVTVTASATPMSDSLITNQTVSNVAQLTFPVMVEDMPITFTVMGPEDMNITEGMSAMVTVMASRGVDADTEVMLMRDGASMAGMDDVMVMPEMVTIMAGEMMAEFEVTAVEDDMMEDMEGVTLFVVIDGMQMSDLTVSFYIWDMAVPALPLVAQLLLGLFLALGGYRRYLRR